MALGERPRSGRFTDLAYRPDWGYDDPMGYAARAGIYEPGCKPIDAACRTAVGAVRLLQRLTNDALPVLWLPVLHAHS